MVKQTIMITYNKVTLDKAKELGYDDNFLVAQKEGHDITEYFNGCALSYWVITEYKEPFAKIMIMKVDEATEYVRTIVEK